MPDCSEGYAHGSHIYHLLDKCNNTGRLTLIMRCEVMHAWREIEKTQQTNKVKISDDTNKRITARYDERYYDRSLINWLKKLFF